MTTHYILVNEAGVYVKEAAFFAEQGGLTQEWGKGWEPIEAESLYAARNCGIKIRRARYPDAHLTTGEGGEQPKDYWPEANGR